VQALENKARTLSVALEKKKRELEHARKSLSLSRGRTGTRPNTVPPHTGLERGKLGNTGWDMKHETTDNHRSLTYAAYSIHIFVS
jgi:hypothetical protein